MQSPSINDESSQHDQEASSSSSSSSNPTQSMGLEEKYQIVRSIGEECIGEEELRNLLANKPKPVCYDGFEPSGRMHIGQGIMKAINVRKLTSAGCRVKILIADWLAWLNNKMDGDKKKIEVIGGYFIEIWKALGMDLEEVEFLWSSKEINARADEYWGLVMDIARRNKLPRIMRCCASMGRIQQNDDKQVPAAQIIYPCMQCADVFLLKADICQMGIDQREVNLLAREYCDDTKRKNKPIILSHYMLPGLQQGQMKMSTSDPLSCIFMDDEEDEVNEKIKKAYCPPKKVEGNPCLEYIKYIVFPWFNGFTVERIPKNGGDKTYEEFEELVVDYESGKLHPADLKPALKKALNKILKPVRDHFDRSKETKDLLKNVKEMYSTITSSENTTTPKTDQSQANESLSINHNSQNQEPSGSSNPIHEMWVEEKFEIIRSIGEECLQEVELKNLLANTPEPVCYDGFEPSGRMHIAQGIMKAINVNKLTSSGCRVKILIADRFAWLNNKMGADMNKIKVIGDYFIEIWKAVGMDLEGGKVDFLCSSEQINARADEYWPFVMDIARRSTLFRIKRCCTIMGRSEQEDLSAAQIFYPCMQCTDIFFLKADICQLGMDQRKVNVLAREYCDKIKRKNKPIILSHHMLPGLMEDQPKMSKSEPKSAIFMDDDEAVVNMKINEAYCPPKEVNGNPCLEYIKYIVFPWFNEFNVERHPDSGGDKTYKKFEELVADYESVELHPADLRPALAKALNKILQPVREHFQRDNKAEDLLRTARESRVTR